MRAVRVRTVVPEGEIDMISQAIELTAEREGQPVPALYVKAFNVLAICIDIRVVAKEGYTEVWLPGGGEPYLFLAGKEQWCSGVIKLRSGAHEKAAQDKKDAERYRWGRKHALAGTYVTRELCDEVIERKGELGSYTEAEFDAEVDKNMIENP